MRRPGDGRRKRDARDRQDLHSIKHMPTPHGIRKLLAQHRREYVHLAGLVEKLYHKGWVRSWEWIEWISDEKKKTNKGGEFLSHRKSVVINGLANMKMLLIIAKQNRWKQMSGWKIFVGYRARRQSRLQEVTILIPSCMGTCCLCAPSIIKSNKITCVRFSRSAQTAYVK